MALLRLALLYGALCGLLLAGGLLYRSFLAEGRLPLGEVAAKVTATGLPFAGINFDTRAVPGQGRQAALTALRRAGFAWVRLRCDWGELEPQPGVFNWAAADAWIGDVVRAGLTPLVVLDGSPAWARAAQDRSLANNPFAPPADPADMAHFAAAFARRYADRVRFYQIWDEPNIAPHWGNRWIEPVAYAQLLKAVAPAIRAVDPNAVIATAALAPTADRGHTAVDEVYFLQRLVAAGAGAAFDAVAIQPFGFGYAPDNSRQSLPVLDFQRAALIRRELSAMGLGDKPLWAVRFGWNREPNNLWGAVTPPAQAAYATAALDLAWRQWPWLEALGWAVDRPAAPPGDPRWGFALSEPGGAPAPVLGALQRWLAAQPVQDRPQSPPLPAAPWLPWLLLAGGLLVAAWRSVAAARLLPWGQWLEGWRRLPWPLQATACAGLLLLYYFAVWPPLIGLCWLLWALLCLAQPRAGLAAAAALLPFYFQHKDLQLVDAVVAVPPATAAAACLLPAVIVRAWRLGEFGAQASSPALQAMRGVDGAIVGLLAISLLSVAAVWHWSAYRQGLLELVLVPLALWFAFRVLDAGLPGRQATFGRTLPGRPALPGRGAGLAGAVGVALFAGGVLAALWGLAAWLRGQGVDADGVRRLVGPHFSPNHTALYLLRTFFLGVGLAAAWRSSHFVRGGGWAQRLDVLLWAATALVLAALLLTGSRGALLLGLPTGFLVLAWAALRRRSEQRRSLLRLWRAPNRSTRWLLLGGLLLVGLLLAGAGLLLWDRLLNGQTLNLRLDLWWASLRLWRAHLLLGTGPGGFFWTYPAYLLPGAGAEPNQLHPHNVWLEVATTWGLLGFAWLGLLLWQVAAAVARHRAHLVPGSRPSDDPTGWSSDWSSDWLAVGIIAALLAALAHAQVDAFFLLPDLAGWNALALALLLSRCQRPYSAG